jgi:dienelactone hydrolase
MYKLRILFTAMLLALLCSQSAGEIISKSIEYEHNGTTLEGYLAYDDSLKGASPGILVVHQWKGLTDYEKMRARMLAELGYIAFAADIYGKGKRAKDNNEAASLAGIYRNDIRLMRGRINAALDKMKALRQVNSTMTAAIGYCFGGTVALELARSGADINGVVTFHGGLYTPYPKDAENIKAKVLVLHGAADSVVPPEQVMAFQKEMSDASVDWYMITYAYAVHAFTQKGPNYNEPADRRSWDEMRRFLEELFGK